LSAFSNNMNKPDDQKSSLNMKTLTYRMHICWFSHWLHSTQNGDLKGPATAVAENRLLMELANSVQQSPSWEVNSYLHSQEIAQILWNLIVHYHAHKSPTLVSTLSKINPVLAHPSYFLKIRFNIILPPMPRFSKLFLSLWFPHQNCTCTSPPPIYTTWPAYLITTWTVKCMEWTHMLCVWFILHV